MEIEDSYRFRVILDHHISFELVVEFEIGIHLVHVFAFNAFLEIVLLPFVFSFPPAPAANGITTV